MQPGQQPAGLIPGAAGFTMTPSMQAFLGQPGQIAGVPGHAILAQRLAVLPPGPRGGLGGGQSYRAAAAQMPMGVMIKPPNRKTNAAVKGRKSCNCKNSKCLKLYCECFASGRYCDNCNCLSCFNNKESEAVRQAAVESILERNPNAFRPKIQTAEGDTHPHSIRNAPDGSVRHTKGCNCKKSSCLKKYCECFQGGIFCTEICKCVDCKNFDGSEARAQVMTHHGDPYGMHAAVAAAAAQQLKRPRMQLQQQPLMQPQGLPANLLQQQPQTLQQLAAAVSMGPAAAAAAAAAALQPLQYQALAGLGLPASAVLPPVSSALPPAAALTGVMPAGAAGAAGLTPAGSTAAALPQLPARPPILDAVHDLVKPAMVEELCSLLVLVAEEKEQAAKANLEQADEQQPQQQQDLHHPGNGLTLQTALNDGPAEHVDADAAEASSRCNGLKRKREGSDAGEADGEDGSAAKRAATGEGVACGAADTGGMQGLEQQNGVVEAEGGELSKLYTAQEGIVLQEFNSIMQRIISQAEKKAAEKAAAETAVEAAAEVSAVAAADAAAIDQAAAAAAAAAAMYDGTGLGDVGDAHQQLQQLQQVADQLQQQQHDQLQQDIKPLVRPQLLSQQQQQQQALAAQQALLMQAAAANNNLALLQASRGLYLQGAAAQQQQQLMQPLMMQAGGVGGGGMGLNALRPNALQMVQVMAQDGSLHHVPAQALLSMQLAAASGLQQQGGQQQQGGVTQAGAAQPAAAAAASGGAGGAAAAQPISLLSLLNGTGTTSGNSS